MHNSSLRRWVRGNPHTCEVIITLYPALVNFPESEGMAKPFPFSGPLRHKLQFLLTAFKDGAVLNRFSG
jgi:hypothetical protein